MKNEFGSELDRNGYATSIFGESDRCYLCGRTDMAIQRHEVWHGSNRDKSKALGLWMPLCRRCHEELHHVVAGRDIEVKAMAQKLAMDHYGWTEDDFRARFGKSYV